MMVAMPRVCAVIGCESPVKNRSLCSLHYSRTLYGRPLLGPSLMREGACRMCGATWCVLPGKRQPKLCGSKTCLRLAMIAEARVRTRERDERIVELMRAGWKVDAVAEEVGSTPSTVSRIARQSGLRRYPYAPRRRH